MTMVRAGWLRRKVTIQSLSQAVDSPGGPTKSYSDYATRWMSIEPLRGTEFWTAKQVYAEQVVQFIVRYDAALHDLLFGPDKRLKVSQNDSPETFRFYDIIEVRNEHERNRRMVIIAKEKAR